MNKLDSVFKEKLADHTVAPTAAAWGRIETGLLKKNNPVRWMRWAAILVPGTILGFLWLSKPEPSVQQVTKAPTSEAPTTVASTNSPNIQQAIEVSQPIAKMKKRIRQKESTRLAQQPVAEPQALTASFPESITSGDGMIIEPTLAEAPVDVVNQSKPLVLVFTLEPIASLPSPQFEEKKTSLMRVVDFAKIVKHSDPLGDLRIMKDEFLAIDLRKKSTKKN